MENINDDTIIHMTVDVAKCINSAQGRFLKQIKRKNIWQYLEIDQLQ